MPAIFFNVHAGTTPSLREALLNELRARSEVRSAAPLRPGAKNDAVQRMFYADLTEDADVEAVLRDLEGRPEIESASLPAERYLTGG